MREFVRSLLKDERIRFLLVGTINTVLGYALYIAFEMTLGVWIGYLGSLYASYAIAVFVAFRLHRRFTFGITGSGRALVDFFRFASVYVVSLIVNTAALPILVVLAGVPPIPAQGIVVVFTTLLSYFGHKWFSFRRPAEPSLLDEHDIEVEVNGSPGPIIGQS